MPHTCPPYVEHEEPAVTIGSAFDMNTFDSGAFGGGEWNCDDD